MNRAFGAFGAFLGWLLDVGLPALAGAMFGEALWTAIHGTQEQAMLFGGISALSLRAAVWFYGERQRG